MTTLIARRSSDLVADLGIRGCDAIYIALAESLGDELVTLDLTQLQLGSAVVPARTP